MAEENTEQKETNPEVEKYLNKIKSQQAQIHAMQMAQAQAEQEMQMVQQQEEQMVQQQWQNQRYTLVPKELLEDCYLFDIQGNFNALFKTIETMCSVVQQSQTQDESRMMIDKPLMTQLINSSKARDKDGMYASINQIFYSMSPNQRETLAKPLIREIQDRGEIEHYSLIQTLKNSVYSPSFFTL